MAYREDAGRPARERKRLVARIRALEGRFTATFWDEVAADYELSAPLRQLEAEQDASIAELARHLSALELALGSWRQIERRWSRAAARVPRDLVPRTTRTRHEASRAFQRLLRDHAAGLPVRAVLLRNGSPTRCVPRLFTTCPLGAGSVHVEPEGIFSDLRKILGKVTEITLGDADFDGVFLVRGHEPTLRAVFSRKVRVAMLRLGELTSRPPTLIAQSGLVSLELGALEPIATIVELCLEILDAVRSAPARPLFRHD